MKIEIINQLGNSNIKAYSGAVAGICYGGNITAEQDEVKLEKDTKRAEFCLKNGHHSIYEHSVVTLHLKDVPKLLCMYLNSMGNYSTTEKSGRYTSYKDNELYNKWYNLIHKHLEYVEKYKGKNIDTLARENARYMISVFEPTEMVYTVNLRQLNYAIGLMEDYTKTNKTDIDIRLGSYFKDFVEVVTTLGLNVEGLRDWKVDTFSLVNYDNNNELVNEPTYVKDLGNVYEARYTGSFSYLAQAQRHRTLKYRYRLGEGYYVPEIIYNMKLEKEWLADLESIKDEIPQAKLLDIVEFGGVDDLKLKAGERLCSEAQHEIMMVTKYIVYNLSHKDIFSNYIKSDKVVARCVGGYKCKTGCTFGGKYGVSRSF